MRKELRLMVNEELRRNEEMIATLEHVSKSCVGAYGYLADITLWLSRKAQWKPLYEGVYECTCCGEKVHVAEDGDYMPKYKYCPYCGAVVRGV